MTDEELFARVVQAEQGRLRAAPVVPPAEPPRIRFAELPEDRSGDAVADAWNIYRREVGRLLKEGHAGRWVLLTRDGIVGMWDTEAEVRESAATSHLLQPVLVRQVCEYEPVLRAPTFASHRCRN